ncbi:YpoC family protein [Staphylococcus agnetis]|uniref:YpoC-like domain-containing protein n=2 Tax=Staphylococcus TaxID=1279 RepID=A0A2T4MIW9_9STAP|nr:hypothetical protein [Staphylococcus agnetis]NJI01903.1 hypothetical protein [Staphylococcus agnetis]NJI14006.1 hypothetical protein [Staphylococcus agnetis]OSP21887.1 hypothetical protein B9L42_04475 [Staphylococcus agnetis]OSP23487.1 hypothetical protein B9M87_08710 [Staphylococcus agnetis]OTW32102.1 hypothetical protein B9M88_00045 [Staphylococcus agnetis]
MMNRYTHFHNLELELDALAKKRLIGKTPSFDLLDAYYELLISYFKDINHISSIEPLDETQLMIKPFNLTERLAYIQQRKHHYMGYQQMKTLKTELIKMHAAYRVRHEEDL